MLTEQELQAKEEELRLAKESLAKAEEERENYRKGLLSREEELKRIKALEEEKEKEKDDEKETEWDENSKKFQEETISKTAKVAEEAALKALEKGNDKTATQDFRESHPEVSDEKWEKIIANYNPKNGKDSIKGIINDLERAYVLYKFDSGEVIDPAELAKKQAENNNKEMNITHGSIGSGKFEEEKGGISDGAKELGKRFGISEELLSKEDNSLSATISMTKR